ncbi:MAG: hypothetical protein AAFZ65_20490 [Planctomycetota bacterium]
MNFPSLHRALITSVLIAAPCAAQTLPDPGQTLLLQYTAQAVDIPIPTVNPPGLVKIRIKGGRGGDASAGATCNYETGGQGAEITARFLVGDSAVELQPGGTLRFVVGERGQTGVPSDNIIKLAAGGGGGGTGVLYRAPGSNTWEPLAVAGGGGGSVATSSFGFCASNHRGKHASLVPAGTSGYHSPATGLPIWHKPSP